MVVGLGIKMGLNIKIENLKEVGLDRIVNVVVVNEFYGGFVVIIDFGMVIIFCVFLRKLEYLGGVIVLGIKILVEVFFFYVSRFYRIEF